MKLWLDDIRAAPAGWEHAKDMAEAIYFAERYEIEEMSLDHDHDLGMMPACDDCEDRAKISVPQCDMGSIGCASARATTRSSRPATTSSSG